MTMQYNVGLVSKWAEDRNLIEGSTPQAQMLKSAEEMGEVAGALRTIQKDELGKEIGDHLVVLTILSLQLGFDPKELINPSTVDPDALAKLGLVAGPDAWLGVLFVYMSGHGDLAAAVAKGKDAATAIHSVVVSLSLICHLAEIDIAEAYRMAYAKIKDRKGRMVNGVFIKEEDFH